METTTKQCGGTIPQLAGTGTGTAITVSEPEPFKVCTEMFHEIPVRIVKRGKEAMFPVVDIAKGIDYDRKALTNLLEGNKEDFVGYSSMVVVPTQAGKRDAVCLNRDGVIALIMALDVKRIKDPAKRQRIREFKKWAIETIGKVMDGIPVQPEHPAPTSLPVVMDHYMDVAARFSQMTGIPRNEVIDVAMRVVESKTGENLELFRQMLVPKKPETIEIQPTVPDARMGHLPKGSIDDFIEQCCIIEGEVPRRVLWDAYRYWCEMNRLKPQPRTSAYMILQKYGVQESKMGQRWAWSGISLNPETRKKMRWYG